MSENFLQLLHPLFSNWMVLVVLIVVAASVVTSIAKQIRKYGCHYQDVNLKRELVERGLTADEIERIVAAKGASFNTTDA